ncbi:multidrug ABC transporter ATP-binding protein [Devosia pacifica]|uniref:Multidrug ABC transporter ATP-binding protein n=1 Tax=Devosia pacifica TaxID=1335967 RepID=A0A918SBT8_9HYPH|nr:ABC transporter ATP-binding protein [Devosia pacifica]GHA31663.1 multidrug ABC transporter ATP-binding protein [Devosia pacifica]
MARKKLDFRSEAFSNVLGFTFRHWRKQPGRIGIIIALVMGATIAEVLTPIFAGRLVDAIASGPASQESAFGAALMAFWLLALLYLASVVMRTFTFVNLITLTLKMMSEIAGDAFVRVQRFSTDWHANSFAGSTVRKVTRGMWALDLLNDTLLVALLPSFVMLVGATIVLGSVWPVMGLVVGVASLIYVGVTVALSVGYVAPAATLSNAWDTRVGGALADAVGCNAVVKAFGAETREESRLGQVVGKWRNRTRRTWKRGTLNGAVQGVLMVVMQTSILGVALMLWTQGAASAGDITFVLTMFFMLQGHLRDVGMHIRNLQKSVNDMEELVDLHAQPIGIDDRAGAKPIRIGAGAIAFRNVTFRYGSHVRPLYEDFSVAIRAGERVGLVGHSGSGKTTFVKLIQRLYDVTDGQILIDGQNIADVLQSSLRSQIAIVQQEPILFHRTLAENIAYARPSATRAEIEHAASLASAHDFISTLPKGYETLVGERGVKLSGGERQRVAIARAFLANAPILILDEATSSLDSESEVLIQQAMERLMIGRTTLVIAHRLSTVKSLDRLLVFDRGRIVEEGDHRSLIGLEGGIYRRLFERQALELTRGLNLNVA